MKNKHVIFLLPIASLLVAASCAKKGGESEPVVILTNDLHASASPSGAGDTSQPKAEVKIAGVSHDEEISLIDLLHVSGLLTRGTQQVAIVNGNVVSMGEEMELIASGHNYRLRVLSISDGSIKLRAEDQADKAE